MWLSSRIAQANERQSREPSGGSEGMLPGKFWNCELAVSLTSLLARKQRKARSIPKIDKNEFLQLLIEVSFYIYGKSIFIYLRNFNRHIQYVLSVKVSEYSIFSF